MASPGPPPRQLPLQVAECRLRHADLPPERRPDIGDHLSRRPQPEVDGALRPGDHLRHVPAAVAQKPEPGRPSQPLRGDGVDQDAGEVQVRGGQACAGVRQSGEGEAVGERRGCGAGVRHIGPVGQRGGWLRGDVGGACRNLVTIKLIFARSWLLKG